MKFDIKKHIYLILLFILSFTVETAQSQEVTNIHIAATDTVPTYTSDSAVINFLKDAGIPLPQEFFSDNLLNVSKIVKHDKKGFFWGLREKEHCVSIPE